MDLPNRIRVRLSHLELRPASMECRGEAAVLIPVFERGGEPHLLLTRRTEEVETHKGQISFPGGMRHGGEALERTALRETFEEVGIAPDQVEILGRFHEYVSINELRVVPFAGYIHRPFVPVPQPAEVAEVLEVPFRTFREDARMRVEERVRLGRKMKIYFFAHGDHEIWGLTARIIMDFLDTIA